MTKIALLVVTLALPIACATRYRITLFQPSVVAGTELKPGEYRLELDGTKVVLNRPAGWTTRRPVPTCRRRPFRVCRATGGGSADLPAAPSAGLSGRPG